jgi:hypothetical protein
MEYCTAAVKPLINLALVVPATKGGSGTGCGRRLVLPGKGNLLSIVATVGLNIRDFMQCHDMTWGFPL